MIEEWKDIKGFEGLYQVSNFGEVKSLKREYFTGNGAKRKQTEIILKPGKNDKGYLHVSLSKKGKSKNHRIHKLVSFAFLGESKLEVNHKDGDKTNNHLNNLEYCSRSENIKHAFNSGLLKSLQGEKNPSAKLNIEIIKNIRENKYNLTKKEFACCYEVNLSTIYRIVNKEKWLNV